MSAADKTTAETTLDESLVRYPGLTEARHALPHQLVMELIMEHLMMVEKMDVTVAVMADEAGVLPIVLNEDKHNESRLSTLLRLARRRVPKNFKNLMDDGLVINRPTTTSAIADEQEVSE